MVGVKRTLGNVSLKGRRITRVHCPVCGMKEGERPVSSGLVLQEGVLRFKVVNRCKKKEPGIVVDRIRFTNERPNK